MKNMGKLLLIAAAAAVCGVLGYMLSGVFGLLRWPVFVLICLFLGELVYRAGKQLWFHAEK